ncbi:MAG: hypothetical protein DBX44_06450 [Oscillospiraceae bacterium]|nr:MAG: hypothetical protein DBX44_06450 [Oscillospiraceae bacterium]
MNHTELQQEFEQTVRRHFQTALQDYRIQNPRFLRQADRSGGVAAAKAQISRGESESFEALYAAGRLDLSLESAVVSSRYHPLFTDDEVDRCLALLCEAGYFQLP